MPIQKAAEVPKYLPSRRAVSAVTGVCSLASRSIRVRGADSTSHRLRREVQGAKEFLAQDLAGMNRGKFLGRAACLSMVIHDLNFPRPLIAPPEHDPALIVYSDRMLSRQVPLQDFQAISRRRHEIASTAMKGPLMLRLASLCAAHAWAAE
jgi:hypothetical protein